MNAVYDRGFFDFRGLAFPAGPFGGRVSARQATKNTAPNSQQSLLRWPLTVIGPEFEKEATALKKNQGVGDKRNQQLLETNDFYF